jgi:hypothetical protein
MRSFFLLVWLTSAAASPTLAQSPTSAGAEVPAWAKGFAGFGVLATPHTPGRSDLEHLRWEEGMFVAQDGGANFYVLHSRTGAIERYTPAGDLRDHWMVKGWESLDPIPALAAFAADRRGTLFAFGERETVLIFDRDKAIVTTKIPTFITGLALADGDVFAARLPIQFLHTLKEGEPEIRRSFLITRLSGEGKVLGETLEPDDAGGPDPFSVAMTQVVRMAADQSGETARVWVADKFRCYRLRRLSSSGASEGEWRSSDVRGKVSFNGPPPEEAKKTLTEEAQKHLKPIDASITVRDLAARGGLVFVLLEPGAVVESPVVDVFPGASAAPVWRYKLQLDGDAYFNRLGVTDDAFWLFPVAEGESPRRVERVPDDVMLRAMAAKSSPGAN